MATTEAQKRAMKKYYESKRSKTQKTISITLTAEQADQDRQIIAEHKTTPGEVWRKAIDRLKAEPIPTEESTPTQTDGESITAATDAEWQS